MENKVIYIFGNPDLKLDSLPITLLPKLKAQFPLHIFTILDPNEEWDVPKDMIIIDTVVGIEKMTVFKNLASFLQTPKVTCHDYDAYTNLQFLMKLKKIDSVSIIGIPPYMTQEEALESLTKLITV
jgi:ADP-heptose:LPS heptosyltransferase